MNTGVLTSMAQPDALVITLLLLQGVWGLFLIVITWAMRRVLRDIEENTRATSKVAESVIAINVLLAGNFVTKPDMDRLWERVRETEKTTIQLKERDDYREMVGRRDRGEAGRLGNE